MEKKLTKEEFLSKCLEFLDYFNVDYSKDTITIDYDSGTSCIMNPKSQFYENFAGFSINSVAEYVAKELNKKFIYTWDNGE
jgi:hypothetical protein